MSVLTSGFAASRGSDLALADDTGTRSWAELDERVNRLIHSFRAAGIGNGDTIAVVAGNCNEWFETAFACANAGITFVPVNWHFVGAEIAYVLGDSGSKAIVCGQQFLAEATKALADPRSADVDVAIVIGAPSDDRFRNFDEFLAEGAPDEPTDQSFGGPMFYTSGTTGNPKGVRGSLATMPNGADPAIWQLVGAGFSNLVEGVGCTVLCGPFYHSAQWAYSFLPMVVGSATVMQHKYDSAGVLRLIDDYAATNIHLVPTQMKRLIDLPDDVKATFDGSSLQLVLHGAAPCPPRVKQAMIDWWGPIITEYYGSTEGSVVTMIDSEEWMARGGSVGRPTPGTEVIVVGDDGVRMGPNQPGTLYFRNAMGTDFEYHNAPEKTADVHLEPGVFTSGDVGYLDDDGYLWLSDRKIDMIISGGVNIYPAETEGVLGGHELVADVAVIGVPNEEFGEEVKAIVALVDGVVGTDELATQLREYCREYLAGYKVPRSIDFLEALPTTGTGKVQKAKLRAPYWEGHERAI
jgi:long-chain acyl-CoA synthetase